MAFDVVKLQNDSIDVKGYPRKSFLLFYFNEKKEKNETITRPFKFAFPVSGGSKINSKNLSAVQRGQRRRLHQLTFLESKEFLTQYYPTNSLHRTLSKVFVLENQQVFDFLFLHSTPKYICIRVWDESFHQSGAGLNISL